MHGDKKRTRMREVFPRGTGDDPDRVAAYIQPTTHTHTHTHTHRDRQQEKERVKPRPQSVDGGAQWRCRNGAQDVHGCCVCSVRLSARTAVINQPVEPNQSLTERITKQLIESFTNHWLDLSLHFCLDSPLQMSLQSLQSRSDLRFALPLL